MADPFKNRLAPKKRTATEDFAAPTKEQATTGRYMCAGDDYGVGFRTSVGSYAARDIKDGPIPQKSKCVDPNEETFSD